MLVNDLLVTEGYTVKVTHAKLHANAGRHLKRPHTQFTCVTCSLLRKTRKFTLVYATSTSHRMHANCLQPCLSLPESSGYFTGKFTCGTHANLPATGLQDCLLLQATIHAICRQKRLLQVKMSPNAGQNNHNCSQSTMTRVDKIPHCSSDETPCCAFPASNFCFKIFCVNFKHTPRKSLSTSSLFYHKLHRLIFNIKTKPQLFCSFSSARRYKLPAEFLL